MSTAAVVRTGLRGSVAVPGDKSISHRLLLMSLLSSGTCRIENLSGCLDVRSSIEAVRQLGGRIEERGEGCFLVHGTGGRLPHSAMIHCGNSGTTMRLLMGILAGADGSFELDGDSSLRRRPMARVAAPLEQMGASVDCTGGGCPVSVRGCPSIKPLGLYRTPVPSAQLKSAVLLAGIQAEGGPTTVVEKYASRDHTERLLEVFGAAVSRAGRRCSVRRSRLAMPPGLTVPGDPSSAAFLMCAAAVLPGSDLSATRTLMSPSRTGFVHVLRRMGADIRSTTCGYYPEPHGTYRISSRPGRRLRACCVSSHEVPSIIDEIPVLSLVATQATGRTIFRGVGELRFKESDRLGAIASHLGAMGAVVSCPGDDLVIDGPTVLHAAPGLSPSGDHRIAMTLALADLLCDADFRFHAGDPSVAVSWPGFEGVLESLVE